MFLQGLRAVSTPHNHSIFHNTQDMERAYIPPMGEFIGRTNMAYENKGVLYSVFKTEGNAAICYVWTSPKGIVLSETN